jgi:hypothetical protein
VKKVIAILIILVMLTLCGCKGKTTATVNSDGLQERSMFVMVEDTYYFDVVYHRDTKVMYAISRGGYNCGNFCLLVNPDGTPMLWGGGGRDD